MEKEERKKFPRMMFLATIILFANIGGLVYKFGYFNNRGLTGFSVTTIEKVFLNIGEMSFVSRIFLIIQWTIVFFVLFYTFYKDKSVIFGKKEISSINNLKVSKKNRTDLDVFHEILKKKKSLKISNVAKSFNISKDVATDWSKILESGELATIEYPGFGEPMVVIKEKVINKDGEENNNENGIEDDDKNMEKNKKLGFFARFVERFKKKKEDVKIVNKKVNNNINKNQNIKNNDKINNVSKNINKKLTNKNNKNQNIKNNGKNVKPLKKINLKK